MHWGKVDVDNSVLRNPISWEKKKNKRLSLADAWYCNVVICCWMQQ